MARTRGHSFFEYYRQSLFYRHVLVGVLAPVFGGLVSLDGGGRDADDALEVTFVERIVETAVMVIKSRRHRHADRDILQDLVVPYKSDIDSL